MIQTGIARLAIILNYELNEKTNLFRSGVEARRNESEHNSIWIWIHSFDIHIAYGYNGLKSSDKREEI